MTKNISPTVRNWYTKSYQAFPLDHYQYLATCRGGDLPMANTSKTSGISLSRSMFQLLCTHTRSISTLYFLRSSRSRSISMDFKTLPLLLLLLTGALSWPSRPWRSKAWDSTGGWLERLRLPGAYLPSSHSSCPTIWSSWRLPRRRTLLKLSLNLVFHPFLAIWTALLSVQNHPLNLCWSIHKVFWNAGSSHMVYAFPLAICTTFAACLRING